MNKTQAEIELTNYLNRLKSKHGIDGFSMYDRILPIFEKYVVPKLKKKQTILKNLIPAFIENNLPGNLLERCEQICATRGTTLKRLCLIHGDVVGAAKFKSYCDKQALTNTFEYKRDKYGWSQEQFDEYNQSRACTLDNLIKRHGKDVGTKKWQEYVDRQSYAGCKLEYFVEKYGDEMGKQKYEDVNLAKSHSLESFERRYNDKEEALEKYIAYMDRPSHGGGYSLNSQKLFEQVCKHVDDEVGSVYYHTLNKEFGKFDTHRRRYYYYDFAIPSIKLIIEYHGDLYHGNPEIYNADDIPPFRGNFKTAAELWAYDKEKQDYAKSLGFDVIIVWESHFLEDETKTVEVLLNEINKRRTHIKL